MPFSDDAHGAYIEHDYGCACGECVNALWDNAARDAALIKNLRLEIGFERARNEQLVEMAARPLVYGTTPPALVEYQPSGWEAIGERIKRRLMRF